MRLLSAVVVAVCATAAAAVMVAGVLMALLSVADARVKAGPNVMSAHHRLKTTGGALDGGTASTPAAAYSFRLLRQAYLGTGAAVRLRRASDQAEADIGFAGNGDWDGVSAAAFCAATNCFIRAWYDQSGNGRNVGQATAANQPALIFNCIGSLPCMSSTVLSQNLSSVSVAWTNAKKSLDIVANRSGTGACYFLLAQNNTIRVDSVNSWTVTDLATAFGMSAADGAWHAGIGVINAASSAGSLDGVEATPVAIAGTATAGVAQTTYLQAGAATCRQAEAIIWDNYALTLAERQNLVANQTQYWMPAPLDTFSTPAAAYSLRKLKSSYAGPAIRLRRASDNAEQDINFLGFVAGLGAPLDVAAANVFCASTSCFIRTWYDQSGNARHATQGTAAAQPAYISNCIGTQPCARSAGATAQSVGWCCTTPVSPLTLAAVARVQPVGTDFGLPLVFGNNTILHNASTTNLHLWTGSGITTTASLGVFHAHAGVINGASSVLRTDAIEATGTVNADLASASIYFQQGASGSIDDVEFVLWNGYALTATERANLTANQRAYWGF